MMKKGTDTSSKWTLFFYVEDIKLNLIHIRLRFSFFYVHIFDIPLIKHYNFFFLEKNCYSTWIYWRGNKYKSSSFHRYSRCHLQWRFNYIDTCKLWWKVCQECLIFKVTLRTRWRYQCFLMARNLRWSSMTSLTIRCVIELEEGIIMYVQSIL